MRQIVAVLIAGLFVAPAAAQVQSVAKPDYEGLVKDLGSGDFEVREEATTALRSAGAAARSALAGALNSAALEQRTRARRLLDELGQGGVVADPETERARLRGERLRPVRPRERPGSGPVRPQGRPRGEVRPQRRSVPRLRDFGGSLEDYMKALDAFMSETRRLGPSFGEIERMMKDRSGIFTFRSRGNGATTTRVRKRGEALELTRSEDGRIRFVVTPGTAPAKPQVYAARDMEAFKLRHPEIYEEYRETGLFDSSRSGFVFTESLPLRPPQAVPVSPKEESSHGARLRIVPALLRAHLPIPKRALVVVRVQPGTLAATVGLRENDIVTHVDGLPVGTVGVFRRLLESSTAPKVMIRVIRAGQPLQLSGIRPR